MTSELWDLLERQAGYQGVEAAHDRDELDAFELVTTDADGWPHVAWVSAGEILPVDRHRIGLCLWPNSTTTANLERDGHALLQGVHDQIVWKARLLCRRVGSVEASDTQFAAFVADDVAIEHDTVPYAEVLSGARYRLHDVAAVTARWREQLRDLDALIESEGDGR